MGSSWFSCVCHPIVVAFALVVDDAISQSQEPAKPSVSFVLFTNKSENPTEIKQLLEKVQSRYDVEVASHDIATFGEEKLRFDVLLKPSVEHKIRINQSNRAKQLYTHLVIYIDGKPRTFYPQKRKNENNIEIERFLQALLEGKILKIHEKRVLEGKLKKKES